MNAFDWAVCRTAEINSNEVVELMSLSRMACGKSRSGSQCVSFDGLCLLFLRPTRFAACWLSLRNSGMASFCCGSFELATIDFEASISQPNDGQASTRFFVLRMI